MKHICIAFDNLDKPYAFIGPTRSSIGDHARSLGIPESRRVSIIADEGAIELFKRQGWPVYDLESPEKQEADPTDAEQQVINEITEQ